MNVVLGIDPGAKGAIALLDDSGELVSIEDMFAAIRERQDRDQRATARGSSRAPQAAFCRGRELVAFIHEGRR
jgi:hypothetical protein